MQKNVTGQKWVVFAFDRTDNTPKTGDAANITANLRIDAASANAVDDTNPTELEDGYYYFNLVAAETNGDYILISPESTTADIQVIGVPGAVWTTESPTLLAALQTTLDSIIATGVVSTAVTSGSYDYSLTAGNIILEALELIAVPEIGQAVNAHDLASSLRTLNIMIKAWQAEGIGLWRNVEGTLFLEYEGYSYDIGPTGDHCSTTAYKTEIAIAAALGDGTITVDSDDDITDGDYIGIELDDGTLQWTTVNGVPAADVVTLTDVLTDSSAINNHVYNYTAKIMRPVELIEARLVNADWFEGYERPIQIKSRDEYMRLSNKESKGSANLIYFEPVLGNAKFHIWPACNDVKEYIKFTGKTLVQDLDLHTNYPDFPQEWMLALSWNLAILVAPKFGKAITPSFEAKALLFKQSVQDFDHENTSVTFVRGRS